MALYFCPKKTETPTKNKHRKNRLIDYNMCEMWWFLLSLLRKCSILHSKRKEIGCINQVIRICINQGQKHCYLFHFSVFYKIKKNTKVKNTAKCSA